MTPKKLALFLFLELVLLTALKIYFFKNLDLSNGGLQNLFFWISIAIVTAALVRRLGVMNFFEAIFVIIVSTVLCLFFDLVITASVAGLSIFKKPEFWLGYLFAALAIFIFHKKRHVQVRNEMHAAHHAHHGHHNAPAKDHHNPKSHH